MCKRAGLIEDFYEASSRASSAYWGQTSSYLRSCARLGEPFEARPGRPLSNLLVKSSGGTTKQLDRLEAAKLIKRVTNPQDRRSSLVRLSAKGRKLIDSALGQHFEAEAGVLAGKETSDINTAISVLRHMAEGLRRKRKWLAAQFDRWRLRPLYRSQ